MNVRRFVAEIPFGAVSAAALWLFTGCTGSRIYLSGDQCQSSVSRVVNLTQVHASVRDMRARDYIKGHLRYQDFRRECAYGRTEEDMTREYQGLLKHEILDINHLVQSLTHVRMKAGKTLDYIYADDVGPYIAFVYSRDIASASCADWSAFTNRFVLQGVYRNHYDDGACRYLAALRPDDSPMSYFELALLVFIGQYGYLECEMAASPILCTADSVDAWLQAVAVNGRGDGRSPFTLQELPPKSVQEEIRRLDLRPYVERAERSIAVSFVGIDSRDGIKRHRIVFALPGADHVVERTWTRLLAGWAPEIWH